MITEHQMDILELMCSGWFLRVVTFQGVSGYLFKRNKSCYKDVNGKTVRALIRNGLIVPIDILSERTSYKISQYGMKEFSEAIRY